MQNILKKGIKLNTIDFTKTNIFHDFKALYTFLRKYIQLQFIQWQMNKLPKRTFILHREKMSILFLSSMQKFLKKLSLQTNKNNPWIYCKTKKFHIFVKPYRRCPTKIRNNIILEIRFFLFLNPFHPPLADIIKLTS